MNRRGSLKCEDCNSKSTKLCQGDLKFGGNGVRSTRNAATGNDLRKTNKPGTTSNKSISIVVKKTVAVNVENTEDLGATGEALSFLANKYDDISQNLKAKGSEITILKSKVSELEVDITRENYELLALESKIDLLEQDS